MLHSYYIAKGGFFQLFILAKIISAKEKRETTLPSFKHRQLFAVFAAFGCLFALRSLGTRVLWLDVFVFDV